jgi:outer membrane protein, multidrug efflux system
MICVRTSAAVLLLLTLSGCKLGPDYKRPVLDVPGQYRGVAPNLDQQQLTGQSFAEMKWPSVYQDIVLQELIKEALTNNYNLRIAAANIEQARASLGIIRANQLPTLSGSYSTTNERSEQPPRSIDLRHLGPKPQLHRRFLGAISQRHGAGPRHSARHRVRAKRSPHHPDLQCGE